MTLPLHLNDLTKREAIIDSLYRVIRGVDHHDVEAFESGFAGEDVVFEVQGDEGITLTGLSTIRANIFDHIGLLDTTHMVSNIRVDIKADADYASLECYTLAQHCPTGRGNEPNGPKLLGGRVNTLDLVRDKEDSMWKIKKWVVKVMWNEGDLSVVQ